MWGQEERGKVLVGEAGRIKRAGNGVAAYHPGVGLEKMLLGGRLPLDAIQGAPDSAARSIACRRHLIAQRRWPCGISLHRNAVAGDRSLNLHHVRVVKGKTFVDGDILV